MNSSKSFILLVIPEAFNFSEGYRTTLKSPPKTHLFPHNPYSPASSSQNSFLSCFLQGP
ncbi:hypothetical protein LguiA_001897 [Lonicera macranthoides]